MELEERVGDAIGHPLLHALIAMTISLVVAGFVDQVVGRLVVALAARTRGELDDKLAQLLHRPVAFTIALFGLWAPLSGLHIAEPAPYLLKGLFVTVGAVYWTIVSLRVCTVVLAHLVAHAQPHSLLQVQTRPVFDMSLRVILTSIGVYFLFLAWNIDVSAWMASAGVIGIAVGFAAKDSLANLFAGLFILVDAPYKIGDYLVLQDGDRGRVTEIGFRSTRLLTHDDVEVIIPNSEMASAHIVNESGGPYERERVHAAVSVSYGTDIDEVRRVLLDIAAKADNVVLTDPKCEPRVRFRELSESGLVFHLLVWIPKPEFRGRVLDQVNTMIYKRFAAEGIDIAWGRDVIVHQPKGE